LRYRIAEVFPEASDWLQRRVEVLVKVARDGGPKLAWALWATLHLTGSDALVSELETGDVTKLGFAWNRMAGSAKAGELPHNRSERKAQNVQNLTSSISQVKIPVLSKILQF